MCQVRKDFEQVRRNSPQVGRLVGFLMIDLNKTRRAILAKKEKEEAKKLYLDTGITLLNLVVGGGETSGWGMGYKAGSIVRDWGDSSSSKSFKICQMLAANKKKYGYKFK